MTVRSIIMTIVQQEDLNFLLTNRIPRRLLTRLVGWFSKIEQPLIRDLSIKTWQLFTDLDLSEAKQSQFRSMHDCFTRELRPGARPFDPAPDAAPYDLVRGGCKQTPRIRCRPATEDCGADPHRGGPAGDRQLEIPGHAHREQGQAMRFRQRRQLPKEWLRGEVCGGDRHQADEGAAKALATRFDEPVGFIRPNPGLLRLAADIHLYQEFRAAPGGGGSSQRRNQQGW